MPVMFSPKNLPSVQCPNDFPKGDRLFSSLTFLEHYVFASAPLFPQGPKTWKRDFGRIAAGKRAQGRYSWKFRQAWKTGGQKAGDVGTPNPTHREINL
jgi:hypothetical protein